MAFRFWDALGYVDELLLVAEAMESYRGHQDESRLAEDLTYALISAADQATDGKASAALDKAEVQAAVGVLVQAFEDGLNL